MADVNNINEAQYPFKLGLSRRNYLVYTGLIGKLDMCGIVGVLGSIQSVVFKKMLQKIAHRGPDSFCIESFDKVHLGHVRLSIIDLSPSSNQPLWDVKRKCCVIFNGEIYNYQLLRQDLINKGYKFNSNGDAEVLVNLYIEYGVQLFEKLSGIFSFAIWDAAEKRLLIARDNYGVKPLYYAQNEEGFYFASEIKSILEVKSIKRNLNYDSLLRTLIFLWSPGEETLFANIKKLKPAHYAFIKDGVMTEYKRYWQWPAYQPTEQSERAIIETVFNSLEAAVKEQLVANVPVGSFLSGGLDSSFIVSLAERNSISKISTFTIDAKHATTDNDGFTDDLPYAKRVAALFDTELDILQVTPDIITLLPKIIYHLDELQADPAPLNVLLICEQAKQKGIKVLLSGTGGDDIFTGYRRHYAVQLEKYWSWLPYFARRVLKFVTGFLPHRWAVFRRISKAFQYADCSPSERLLSYFYWLDPKIAFGLFTDSIQLELSESPMKFLFDELNQLETDDPIEKMLYLERNYFLVDHNLNYTDKMSMACGVEVRVPFLDQRVIATAAKIPSVLKQKGNIGKWALKKAAEKILPKDIIYRSKSGFGVPLRSWLKTDLAPLVEQYLSKDILMKRGIFNPQRVGYLVEQDRSGKHDYSYPIFALLCFEIWCQQFLD